MSHLKYHYDSIPIPGGGFVTGLIFHPIVPNILYARTDVGGLYRFDFTGHFWIPLLDWVNEEDFGLMHTLSVALDNENPGRIFLLAGNSSDGNETRGIKTRASLLESPDYGKTWTNHPVPFNVNGNGPSRSCYEKLAYFNGKLYYASPGQGLFMSEDFGNSWQSIPVPNRNLAFIKADPNGKWLLISSTGEPENFDYGHHPYTTPIPPRKHSLYISICGSDFYPLPQPQWHDSWSQHPAGYVAMSCDISESGNGVQELYVTFSGGDLSSNWRPYYNFCCECGGGSHGRLIRYTLNSNFHDEAQSIPKSFEDLTPTLPETAGVCGVAVSGNIILFSTVNRNHNYIFRSFDHGKHFDKILVPENTDICDYAVPYMKPKYNNGIFLVHWMSCLALNPHKKEQLFFNTGTGVFEASGVLSSEQPHFRPVCDGLEETVHLNIYAPKNGPIQVLDIVGDLGGFAFRNVSIPCENSFASEKGDRYITCNNADFTDEYRDILFHGEAVKSIIPFVSTARGNWRGVTKGGLILSLDNCDSFVRMPMPYGLSPELDNLCHQIEQPNVNAGWCALSCDAGKLLWTPAKDWFRLPASLAVLSTDWGESWEFIHIFDCKGKELLDSHMPHYHEVKFFSDRVNPDWFFGFGEEGQIYVSTDGGRIFHEKKTFSLTPGQLFPSGFYFSGIDGMKRGEIRVCPDVEGSIYVSMEQFGLWHIHFDGNNLFAELISSPGDTINRVGLGIGASPENPSIFVSGKISGVNGLFMKTSSNSDWLRINDDAHQFGSITGITGDMKRPGVVYVATGGRGIFTGKPV